MNIVKKLILSTLFSLFFLNIAGQNVSDQVKMLMIQDINNGKFEQAKQDIYWLRDCQQAIENQEYFFDYNKVDEFLIYLDSVGVDKSVRDNFCLYVAYQTATMPKPSDDRIQILARYSKYVIPTFQRILGTDHHDYAVLMLNIGITYYELDKIDKALDFLNQSKKILETRGDTTTHAYALTLTNIAACYLDSENNKIAEDLLFKAKKIFETYENRELDSDYALALSNLGAYYSQQGSFDLSFEYLNSAIKIYDQLKEEPFQFERARLISIIGKSYYTLGRDTLALSLKTQALHILDSIGYQEHPLYTTLLIETGSLWNEFGESDLAYKHFTQALANIKASPNVNENDLSLLEHNLGYIALKRTQYDTAETLLMNSLARKKKKYAPNHEVYLVTMRVLAELYDSVGNYEQEYYYQKEIDKAYKKTFSESLDHMPERQRIGLWNTFFNEYYDIFPRFTYNAYANDHSIGAWAYNNELFTKGLLLRSAGIIDQSIYASNDKQLIAKLTELKARKDTLNTMLLSGTPIEHLVSYEKDIVDQEKALTKASQKYRNTDEVNNLTYDNIRKALKRNQVAIEFMRVAITKDSTISCALLLRDTCSYPFLIPLQNDHIWTNILPYINIGEDIFFAPTVSMSQMPIENMMYDSTRTMNDVYNMIRLSSTREIVMRRKEAKHRTAALFGGINYDSDVRELAAMAQNRSAAGYLKGSKEEIDDIQKILTNKHIHTDTYSDQDATEEEFRALSGSNKTIVHVATHGFYWEDTTAVKQDFFKQRTYTGVSYISNQQQDPQERCGLLFTGANIALRGKREQLPNDIHDGVLTAKEIATLDLHNADLVVLSACQTGMGEISGDGILGLQRAFKTAGVGTILMSLWQVDDSATRSLMTAFYRYWIGKKLSKREAFRRAQKFVREQYQDRYYWAGFIMLD